ncbi:MAG: DUF1330 domain-containing protein [Burkholderiales bacterium]|jgi:uncharacterized protein (DUF1330 family)|nr:DUF1330 domain-containing protein [Betaproteobacteria bacterium]
MNLLLINPIARCCLAALAVAVTSTSILAQAQAPSQGQSQAIAPGYLVVLGRSFDRNKIIAYSAALPPIYAETGGHYIGIGRPGGGVSCVYGLCEGRSAVIARWADQKGIDAFWWGDAYRKAIRLRDGAGVFTVVGLKAITNTTPFDAGALLIGTMSIPAVGSSDVGAAQAWIDSATATGARLLAPFSATAVIPLEGDALYNRVVLLSFESKDKRDAFAVSAATKSLLAAGPPLTIVSIIAVDAPQPAPKTSPAASPVAK